MNAGSLAGSAGLEGKKAFRRWTLTRRNESLQVDLEVEESGTTPCLPSASELWTWYDQLVLPPSLPWHDEPHHFLLYLKNKVFLIYVTSSRHLVIARRRVNNTGSGLFVCFLTRESPENGL